MRVLVSPNSDAGLNPSKVLRLQVWTKRQAPFVAHQQREGVNHMLRVMRYGIILCLMAAPAVAQIQYSIQDSTPLLDEAYYLGEAGQFGAVPDAAGRWAYFASSNPAGTKVAFLGLTLGLQDQELYVVDIGNPSSWRQVTFTGVALEALAWSADGNFVAQAGRRVRIADGDGVHVPFYFTTVVQPADVSAVRQNISLTFEFNTPGDLEGWGPEGLVSNNMANFVVADGVMSANMTGPDPYTTSNFFSVDASTNAFVVVRMRVGGNSARRQARVFWGRDPDGNGSNPFTLGPDPSQFYTYVVDVAEDPDWFGTINALQIHPVDADDGFVTPSTVEIDFISICANTSVVVPHQNRPIDDAGNVHIIDEGKHHGVSRKPSNNIGAAIFTAPNGWDNILVSNVLNDGSIPAPEAQQVAFVTNLTLSGNQELRGTHVAHDASLIAFYVHTPSTQPDPNLVGFESDLGEVYLLTDVLNILNAPQSGGDLISDLAPTSLADPRIRPLRVQSEGKVRVTTFPVISQDKKLVAWAEDQNERWVADQGFDSAFRFTEGDWDVGLSRVDNGVMDFANSSNDVVFFDPGNDSLNGITPGGTRVLAQSQSSLAEKLRIFIATFRATQVIPPTQTAVVPSSTTEVMIGGETVALPPEIVLTDSAVQATEEITVEDASGTVVMIPQDQVINFPAGTTTKSIVVETPVAPTTLEELPDDLTVAAVPVKRTFGPAGTQFFPPITITIEYTDAEVEGLDESSITPYLFNEATMKFDTPVAEDQIVSRDLVNNKITFKVDHFSTYGLAFGTVPEVPATSAAAAAVLMGLLTALGVWATLRRTRRA